MKKLLLILPALLFALVIHAQREKGGGIITQEQVRKITELVKPLSDQLVRQIGGDPRYLAYVEDVKKLQSSGNSKERSSIASKIKEKYSSFIKDAWSALRVDESGYQNKIRRVFPADIASLIQFSDFLNFNINSSYSSKSQALEDPGPDKCLDVCSMAVGEIINSSALLAGSFGSWGNCYLNTDALSIATVAPVATAETNGYLRNGISIPGTLADDARTLRVKINFDLKQYVMCCAILGGGGYAETRVQTFSSNEFLVAYAPIIWFAEGTKTKAVSENYGLLKKNVSLSTFWSMSKTFTLINGIDMAHTNCDNIKWTICEQK